MVFAVRTFLRGTRLQGPYFLSGTPAQLGGGDTFFAPHFAPFRLPLFLGPPYHDFETNNQQPCLLRTKTIFKKGFKK